MDTSTLRAMIRLLDDTDEDVVEALELRFMEEGEAIVDELEALLSGDASLSSHGGVKNSEYSIPKQVLDVILKKGVPGRKKRR